ncbi:MAG: phosphoenolpyruvate carboxylase [Pseudomonadota bacterium]
MDTQSLRQTFQDICEAGVDDPLVNPVRKVASDLFLKLENNLLSIDDLSAVITDISVQSFEDRMRAFHERHGPQDITMPHSMGGDANVSFEEYKKRVEKCAVGVVFTAHPTFALGKQKRDLAASYPSVKNKKALAKWRADLAKITAPTGDDITLQYEHDEARIAIENAQNAVQALNDILLKGAERRFPDKWRELCPDPVSLATWVGYDLDGRTDIHWAETIRIRLAEKAAQLRRYAEALDGILAPGADSQIKAVHDQIAAAASLSEQQAALFTGDLSDPETVVNAANFLTRDHDTRLISLAPIIDTLSAGIAREKDSAKARALCLLRAEMRACGLGVARIHLRVNAAQVRSALKTDFGLDPDTEFSGRSALAIAAQRAQAADKRSINFGSVFLEQMTARRQFMLCAQILKHIDVDTPIRFLIAECEAPATVMGAVYLARLYGVDHKLDISPLFETPQALEGGGRFIERLLDEPEYRDYIRLRKRMSIQIGFSDSGRFMGQCAAALAAERLQVLFARALDAAGLPDVEALIFNTHGESMGRGTHPGTFHQRINHTITPWVRSRFQKSGIGLNSEFSFQGGEGYLHFQTPSLSNATVQALWNYTNEIPSPDYNDAFYADINFSWDFYRSLKAWQEDLYQREDYRRVLFSFPKSLLFKTGSRKTRRQEKGGAPEIRSVRAIPHNAMLQQIAIPSNVSGGVGIASGREMDKFLEHTRGSVRMQELLAMAFHARSLTSISILRAYAGIYAPSFWSALAGNARKTTRADSYETVLQVLQADDISISFNRLADFLARDFRNTDAVRDALSADDKDVEVSGLNVDLSILHAVRQALISRAASLVASAPAFSRRHDVEHSDLIEMSLELRLDDVIDALASIFPRESPAGNLMQEINEPVEGADIHGGYPEIHADIVEPLKRIRSLMHELSVAITNFYGAYG